MDEQEATRVAEAAVEAVGGTRKVYRNPRYAFTLEPTRVVEVDGHAAEIRWGEVSSPAIVTVEGYVFEIHDEGIELLIRPSRRTSGE
jgi:hypothetical protein